MINSDIGNSDDFTVIACACVCNEALQHYIFADFNPVP